MNLWEQRLAHENTGQCVNSLLLCVCVVFAPLLSGAQWIASPGAVSDVR